MRSKLLSLLTVIGAVTVLVLAANTVALATTGKAIIGGKTTSVAKATGITRTTAGNVLTLKSKTSSDAPLVVNGKGKVTNLNADTVDGKDSSVLQTRGLVWSYAGSTTSSTSRTWSINLPVGSYLINYEVFLQPSNSAGVTDCYLQRVSGSLFAGESASGNTPFGVSVTGAGQINMVAAGAVHLTCNATNANTWTIPQGQPVRITAIPLPGYALQGAPAVS